MLESVEFNSWTWNTSTRNSSKLRKTTWMDSDILNFIGNANITSTKKLSSWRPKIWLKSDKTSYISSLKIFTTHGSDRPLIDWLGLKVLENNLSLFLSCISTNTNNLCFVKWNKGLGKQFK